MTREHAIKITKALTNIEDFEILFDEIEVAVQNTIGDFSGFYENQLIPMLQAELDRRKTVLEEM